MIPTNNTSFIKGAWAITEQGMTSLLRSAKLAMQANFDMDDFFNTRDTVAIDDHNIAHIDIKGALMDNAPGIFEKIGCTDYRTIREEIAVAQEAGATGIMFNIDSPGGTVAGLEEASAAIASASVPTIAHVDGMGCSAAYHLAASCNQIGASPSADVGNIGTVLAWYDDSEFLAKLGFKAEVITNEGADLKGTFRDSPMSESQREFLQEETNRLGDAFQQHVSANRPNIDSEVFRAGWYSGDRAGELGLVDAICTRTEARDQLAQVIQLKSE